MGGVNLEKAALRRELLARRDALPGRAEKSRAIQSRVLALPEYQRARRVLLYLSKGSEVDTWPLLDCALAQGKEVYAPRCLARPGEMAFYHCFLAAQPVRTVGLCFEALAFERLPRDGFDRPVCRLVTEAGDARPGKEGFL